MKILCVSGLAGSGKDTLAAQVRQALFDLYGESAKVIHYADLLKYMCKEHFGWDGVKDDKGRELLQRIGTDVFRKIDEDYWVKTFVPIIKAINIVTGIEVFIIPDCRFENEIRYMKDNFDTTHVRVRRQRDLAMTAELAKHASEHGLDDVEPDYWIDNNGTIEDLYAPALTLATWLSTGYDQMQKSKKEAKRGGKCTR